MWSRSWPIRKTRSMARSLPYFTFAAGERGKTQNHFDRSADGTPEALVSAFQSNYVCKWHCTVDRHTAYHSWFYWWIFWYSTSEQKNQSDDEPLHSFSFGEMEKGNFAVLTKQNMLPVKLSLTERIQSIDSKIEPVCNRTKMRGRPSEQIPAAAKSPSAITICFVSKVGVPDKTI